MATETTAERVARIQRNIDRIENQYGKGVRPSWVSTDLAILYAELRNARAE